MKIIQIIKDFVYRSEPKAPKPEAERLSFLETCNNIRQLTEIMGKATSGLKTVLLDIEDFWTESWKREKESKKRYHHVVENLILLLDYLENRTADAVEEKSDESNWLYKRLCQILENEGIIEMLVGKGELFNGKYHIQVESRQDELPRDAILEVTRKGYFMKSLSGQEDAVFRSAEVIVSNGPPEKQPEAPVNEEDAK
jgi:molecular chaperone GrpE (heat shock protein)